jgi:hypothetical protein
VRLLHLSRGASAGALSHSVECLLRNRSTGMVRSVQDVQEESF